MMGPFNADSRKTRSTFFGIVQAGQKPEQLRTDLHDNDDDDNTVQDDSRDVHPLAWV